LPRISDLPGCQPPGPAPRPPSPPPPPAAAVEPANVDNVPIPPAQPTPPAPRRNEIEALEELNEDEDDIVAPQPNPIPAPAPTPAAIKARVRVAKSIQKAKDKGEVVPKGWQDAMNSPQAPKWIKGEGKEWGTLREKDVFDIVNRKVGQVKPLPCHFVYALKRGEDGEWMYDEDGEIDGQKVRLVADGNFQDKATLKKGLYLSTASGECAPAYLEADLPYEVYLYFPKSNDPELEEAHKASKLLLLKKCLYGLVESGMFWARLLKDLLVAIGYTCLNANRGVYALHKDGNVCYVPTHLDDLLGATDSPALWKYTIDALLKRITFSKDGTLGQHLGALVEKAKDESVYVSMEPYIVDMNTQFGMRDCSPCPTHMLAGTYVTSEGPPLTSISKEDFVTLVAKLHWIFQVSHPEIAVPVNSLGRHLHNPTEGMMVIAKWVM
ncbi:hypothetical protein P7C70_g8913, partial [Phenoliferia sp. Uapishka_3]